MANFADLQEAEARITAQMLAGVWIEGYSMLDQAGLPKARFLRKMDITDTPEGTVEGMNTAGAWDETRSDTAD